MTQRLHFLGLPLDTGFTVESICALLGEKTRGRFIMAINPAAWAEAKRQPEYLAALEQADVVIPDGEGVAFACRLLEKHDCRRLSFDMTSLADPFFKRAIQERATVMLIGGKPSVDEQVHEKLQAAYKDLKITGTLHGYGPLEAKVAAVMEQKPDVVIAGMGAPRQELFLHALRAAGYRGLAITCGGFFDQYLLADTYYPEWIDQWNLRFAYRLYKEPARLWRRYLIDYQVFIWRVLGVLAQRGFNKSREVGASVTQEAKVRLEEAKARIKTKNT